jgi:hypothetical protein
MTKTISHNKNMILEHNKSYRKSLDNAKSLKYVELLFNEWFEKNMIYCSDTHSFVHRLMERWGKDFPSDYHVAQYDAQEIIDVMYKDFKKKCKVDYKNDT